MHLYVTYLVRRYKFMENTYCVTKKEAANLLGVSLRHISRYLASGALSVDHKEKGKVMIDVSEVYSLREQNKNRKGG